MENFPQFASPNNMYPGVTYPNYQQPTMTQALSTEEMARLSRKGGGFSSQVTEDELLRTYCTHKKDGRYTLNNNGDGTYTCPLCQETFAATELDQDHVKQVTTEMNNILQMIKTAYVDMPVDTIRQFFPFMALLKKTPELAEIAVRNIAKYEQGNGIQSSSTPYGFGAFNSLIGGNAAGGYGYVPQQPQMQPGVYQGQPMPQQQYQQPQMQPGVYQGQPMPQQQYQQPGFMPVNEFGGYGQPQYGAPAQYNPTPVYQPAPQQGQQAPQGQPAPQPQVQQAPQQQAPNGVIPQPTVDVSGFNL